MLLELARLSLERVACVVASLRASREQEASSAPSIAQKASQFVGGTICEAIKFLCAFKILAQQVVERVCRTVPVEDFPGSIVEQPLHGLDFGSRESVERRAFGEELAQEPIRVLVGNPIPRTLRVNKVDLHLRLRGEEPVLAHVLYLVIRKAAPELRGQRPHFAGKGPTSSHGVFGLQRYQQSKPRGPLHQGAQRRGIRMTHEQGPFPMPRHGAIRHNRGALGEITINCSHLTRTRCRQSIPSDPKKNIFAPLEASVVLSAGLVVPSRAKKAAPPAVIQPAVVIAAPAIPTGPSPEEMAAQEARRQEELRLTQLRQQEELRLKQVREQMGQFRYLGYLSQQGVQKAFIGRGNDIYIIRRGDKLDGKFLVAFIDPAMVKLREPITSIEASLELKKDGEHGPS